jgi:hypothetical protein
VKFTGQGWLVTLFILFVFILFYHLPVVVRHLSALSAILYGEQNTSVSVKKVDFINFNLIGLLAGGSERSACPLAVLHGEKNHSFCSFYFTSFYWIICR